MQRLLNIEIVRKRKRDTRGRLDPGKPDLPGSEVDIVVFGFEGPIAPESPLAPDAENITQAIFAAVRS
jgi:hypothetical protein